MEVQKQGEPEPYSLSLSYASKAQFENLNRYSLVAQMVKHLSTMQETWSRQEYWNGLPCSPPGDLPKPGIKPESPVSPALVGGFLTTSTTWEALFPMVLYVL